MSLDLGEINIKITIETKSFDKDAEKVEQKTKKMGSSFQDLGKKVRDSVNSLVKWGAAATAAAAAGAAAIVKSSLETTRELNNQARAAGLSVKAFQQGAFAAKQVGIEQDKYADILKDVNDRIGDFITTGAGPMADFFNTLGPKIGVTIEQFKGLNSEQALGLFVTKMQQAGLSTEEMTFHMEAIASDSTLLIPLLGENSKKLNELKKSAEGAGIGLDSIDVANAIEAQKQLDILSSVVNNQIAKAVSELAPLMIVVTERFQGWVKEAGGFRNMIIPAIKNIAKVVGVFADGLRGIEVLWVGLQLGARTFEFIAASVFDKVSDAITDLSNWWNKQIISMQKSFASFMTYFDYETAEKYSMAAAQAEFLMKQNKRANSTIADDSAKAMEKIAKELDALMRSDLPSFEIQKKLEALILQSEVVAQKIKANLSTATQETPATAKPAEQAATPAVAAATGTKSALQIFQDESMSLYEALGLRHQTMTEMQLAQNEKEIERLKLHKAKTREEEAKNLQSIADLEKQSAALKKQRAEDDFKDGIQLLISGSKRAQKIIKGAAIADALIKGKQAAVDAWEAGMSTGGPFAPVVAAAYTAASLAKTNALVNSIKNSGSSSGGGGGGGIPGGVAGIGGGGSPTPAAPVEPARVFNVDLTGSSNISTQQARNLLELMNQQTGDGLQLNVRG